MHTIRSVFIGVFTCCLASACASAPISVVGSNFVQADNFTTPEQMSLRTAIETLETVYSENSWVRSDTNMQVAQRWMDRLTGLGAEDATPPSLLDVYVSSNDLLSKTAHEITILISEDLEMAYELASQVDLEAVKLLTSGTGYTRLSLSRDLTRVQRSIAQTRQAIDLFNLVIANFSDTLDETQTDAITERRNQLAWRSDVLRDRADDISEIRRYGHHRAVS
jgi:hypothetical protein